ncbi:TPA: hypothetical protein PCJ90_001358 [Klebsiella quasipneumoniae]|nr:hypothetical protein [Klebsiella quasipneumoniae]
MSMKAIKSAPPESFRELVFKAEDGRWYFKDIPKNKLRNLTYAIGHSLEVSNPQLQRVKYSENGSKGDYLTTRLIYWLETGKWPHIVRIKDKEKPLDFDNLEGIDIDFSDPNQTDLMNIKEISTKTKGKRFETAIRWEGKQRYIGTYDSLIEAKIASIKVRILLSPEQKDVLTTQLIKLVKNVVQGK